MGARLPGERAGPRRQGEGASPRTYGQKVVGGFRFHDVRATFDTNLERAGVSETRRKALMGNSLSGMDKHYIRLKDDDLRQAIDQYTAWIDAQTASVTQTVPQEAARG